MTFLFVEKAEHELKVVARTLARMNPTATDDGILNHRCGDQKMQSWSAFNSLVTTEHIEEQIVSFLPVVPHPVRDYATVFTTV